MTNAYTPWEREWSGAKCAGVDTNVFFLPDEKLKAVDKAKRIRQAKGICFSCPIRAKCLNYAINRDEVGVWGGMSDKERAGYKKTAQQFLSSKNRSKLFL